MDLRQDLEHKKVSDYIMIVKQLLQKLQFHIFNGLLV